ncbi:MAG: DUF1540 domain-containing protein [Bacillota bacterium]
MRSKIKCMVEECAYQERNRCTADAIEVRSSGEDRVVHESDGTACETFRPRG